MKWIENIRLLTSYGGLKTAIEITVQRLIDIEGHSKNVEIHLLQNALYEGDISVILMWENERKPVKSREGLLLAENLQAYGPVNHTVWHMIPYKKQM